MSRRVPSTTFEIRFKGPRVAPEAIPLRTLARALSAVQRLISEDREDDEPAEEPTPQLELHLLDVRRGSATYPVFAEESAQVIERLKLTGTILKDPEMVEEFPSVLSPVEDLSAIAKTLDCEIELSPPGKSGILARITPASFDTLVGSAFICGETSVSGVVERVGGATELRCGLRVSQQPRRMVICQVETPEAARELGKHLYESVIVEGTATWYRRNWRLKSFLIKSVRQVRRSSLTDAIKELRDAGGNAWDRVKDPRKFLSGVRGE